MVAMSAETMMRVRTYMIFVEVDSLVAGQHWQQRRQVLGPKQEVKKAPHRSGLTSTVAPVAAPRIGEDVTLQVVD